MTTLYTPRLELVPISVESLRAELEDWTGAGRFLNAKVPTDYPAEGYDAAAVQWLIDTLEKLPADTPWQCFYIVWTEGERTLVGGLGFKGPPANRGVEIGYSVVASFRRRGIAVEAVSALVHHAFAQPDIDRVLADTMPELTPSIGVLTKCGFRHIGTGPEEGTIRYEKTKGIKTHSSA